MIQTCLFLSSFYVIFQENIQSTLTDTTDLEKYLQSLYILYNKYVYHTTLTCSSLKQIPDPVF